MSTRTGLESSLSPWAGPYVTDMLGKGKALAETPYQEYGGELVAGASPLQSRAFQGLGSLGIPQATMSGTFSGSPYTPPTSESILDIGLQLPLNNKHKYKQMLMQVWQGGTILTLLHKAKG